MTRSDPAGSVRVGWSNSVRLFKPIASLLLLPLATMAQAPPRDGERHLFGDGVQLSCAQPQPESLDCRYRPVFGGVADSAAATLGGTVLPAPLLQDDPLAADGVVLLLIDTSDPAREQTVAANVRHARALIDALPAGQRVGVAAFDSNLRVIAGVGTPRVALGEALGGLRAVGRTTEGYRSLLEAVRLLAALPAGRRTLVVFSDGLFEDRAYFHRDVVDAARDAGVVVNALGYARSVSLSVALQTLRRLAEETGGVFSTAAVERALPSSFVDAMLAGLRGGGRVLVDLAPGILATTSGGSQPLRLTLVTANGVATASVPVQVPAPLPPPPPESVVINVPAAPELVPMPAAPPPPAPAAAPLAAPADNSLAAPAAIRSDTATSSSPIYLGSRDLLHIVAGAVGVALLLVLALLVLRRKRRPGRDAPSVSPMDTLAFLETEDGTGRRHAVTSALYRIGRHADNDLVLNDGSISRHHAQLHRHRDGSFSLRDLESLNGVFVNGEQVQESGVSDGDLLEIGDVALRFRGQESSELGGEDTIILKTALPSNPLPRGAPGQRSH